MSGWSWFSRRKSMSAEDIRKQLLPERQIYVQNAPGISRKIETLLKEQGFQLHQVSHRIKGLDSAIRKVQSKGADYSPSDLTDILGVRVIVFRESDIAKCADILSTAFDYDPENSIDKTIPKQITAFGYRSLHLILRIDSNWHRPLPFEVQIRTVLQHAWAELEHSAIYKSDRQVTPEVRRKFARLSGTFELLDSEIDRILEEQESGFENPFVSFFDIASSWFRTVKFLTPLSKNTDRDIALVGRIFFACALSNIDQVRRVASSFDVERLAWLLDRNKTQSMVGVRLAGWLACKHSAESFLDLVFKDDELNSLFDNEYSLYDLKIILSDDGPIRLGPSVKNVPRKFRNNK